LNDVQEKWLGTLTSVPNKGKKVPRHAPACLIGCAAYACKNPADSECSWERMSAKVPGSELARVLLADWPGSEKAVNPSSVPIV